MKLNSNIIKLTDKKFGFAGFVLASMSLHFLFLGFLFLTAHLSPPQNKPEVIEISLVDVEKEKIIKIKNAATLIVESNSENANNELSENAKFLSEKSNNVKKETKAKHSDKFHNTKNYASQASTTSKTTKTQKLSQTSKPKLFEEGFDAYASINKKEVAQQKQQTGRRANDASTTNDYLAKIEDDLMTRLNTKEYKYFGYYSRIKNQLNQWWVPKVQQKFAKMLSQGRTIASEENKITKLVIILNNSGHLVAVQVLAESGVRDLDDAAIEAFRSAAPFPNPPKGMVDSDGRVKIRWDCVVES
ncbi:MAG: energy transducer TonB [Bdellovibrionota bacterium]